MVSWIPKYQQCLGGTCVDCRRRPESTHSLAEKRNRYRARASQNDIATHRDLELQLQSRPDKRIVPLRRRFGFRCTNPKALDDSSSADTKPGESFSVLPQSCAKKFLDGSSRQPAVLVDQEITGSPPLHQNFCRSQRLIRRKAEAPTECDFFNFFGQIVNDVEDVLMGRFLQKTPSLSHAPR